MSFATKLSTAGFLPPGTIGGGVRYVHGTSAGETLYGGVATDHIFAYGGDDRVFAGGGFDVVHGDAGNDWLRGEDGNDNLYGGADNDILEGGAGDDFLDVGSGANSAYGGDGNDTFVSGVGANWFSGGAGSDTVDYRYATAGTFVDLAAGVGKATGWLTDDLFSVENVSGTDQADVLRGDASANSLFGRGGNDELRGEGGDDYLSAHQGNDRVYGGAGNDVLRGDLGNDRLSGGLGDDDLRGESGTDTAWYVDSATRVNVNLTTGLATGEGNDTLSSVEDVYGSRFADTITGDNGSNILVGGQGWDHMRGSQGRDTLFGDAGDDFLYGENGNDRIYGGDGNDLIDGGTEKVGDNDQDTFDDDVLTGNSGADVFSFSAATYTLPWYLIGPEYYTRSGHDTITDFDPAEDRISLRFHEHVNTGASALADFAELMGNARQIGDDVLMEFGRDSVSLLGVDLGELTFDSFIL